MKAAPGGAPCPLLLCLALDSGGLNLAPTRDGNAPCLGEGATQHPARASRTCPHSPECHCSGAWHFPHITGGHSTGGLPCGTAESCSGNMTQGHFSRCPEEYKHYCIKGRCRFVMAEKKPACVCERGYTGARCEMVDIFYLRGDRGQIVIISLIAAIITLIILIICACFCSHHCRKQRRKRKAEEMEMLNKNLPSKSEDVLETGIA